MLYFVLMITKDDSMNCIRNHLCFGGKDLNLPHNQYTPIIFIAIYYNTWWCCSHRLD